MDAENAMNGGCPQRDSAEHEGYAGAHRSFRWIWKEMDSAQPELFERTLESREKFKARLKELSSRKRCQSMRSSLKRIDIYAQGWLNYYGIADMKNAIDDLNGWLYHRIRMCIWKQWKLQRTKLRKLKKLGVEDWAAYPAAYSRRGYWFVSNTWAMKTVLTKERLIRSGFYDLAIAYQSAHVNC